MEVDADIRRLIHRAAATHEVRERLRRAGVHTLREEGALLAFEGKTSLDEILRVTHADDDLPDGADTTGETAGEAAKGRAVA